MTKEKLFKTFISIIEIAIIFSLMVSFALIFRNARKQGRLFDVSKNWTVTLDDEMYTNVDISNFRFSNDVNGNIKTLTMTKELSEEMLSNTTLRVYNKLCTMSVYLDDELIYEVTPENANKKQYMGMGYYFILLPNHKGDHLLTLEFTAMERGAISGLPNVELSSTERAYPNYVDENVVGIFASIFLVVLGLIITVVSLAYTYLNVDYFRLFLIGVFSFTTGMWSMCSQKVMLLLGTSVPTNSTMEYLLMELAFLPLLGYTIKIRENLTNREKSIIRSVMIVNILYNLFAASLHFTNVAHYSQTVLSFYVIAFINCATMLFVGVKDITKANKGEMIFHYSIFGISLAGFWLIFDHINGNYISRGTPRLAHSFTPVVLILFVVALMASYAVHLYSVVLSSSQEEALTTMVYKDSLTGLYNRIESEETFQRLDQLDNPNYMFIDFDLNGLKKLNDEKGHAAGDLLIQSFANVLKEAFSKYGKSMRMGGDEFLTIIEGKKIPSETELMQKYHTILNKYCEETGLDIDASYGIANSSEVYHPLSEQIFRLADERMYEMKRLSKKGRER